MKTPVVLLIFKRPNTTKRVFEAIRQAKPAQLFVIADGPRSEFPEETEKCAATRRIIERVDWNCQVFTNYSDINLGCGKRVATGINWVFDRVEEAIILEDDCLPHPDFFGFCEDLLEKYRHDSKIMHISGNYHLLKYDRFSSKYGYYFSRYPLIWGWATWRRAWKHYDFQMKNLPELIENGWLEKFLENKRAAYVWTRNFYGVYNSLYTWDYQWILTCWTQAGLSIHPSVNLVSNIGFDVEATHTQNNQNYWANLPTQSMMFPLKHPPFILRDTQADRYLQSIQFDPNKLNQAKMKFKQLLNL
jgi:hypothetical protein